MKKIISFLAILSTLMSMTAAIKADVEHIEFHVAVDGSDLNPGTEEKPFATLTAARNAVRNIKKKNKPIDVLIHGGEYWISETVSFTDIDTGNEKAPVTYKAAGDGEPILKGGVKFDISGFEPVTDKAILNRLPDKSIGRVGQLDLSSSGLSSDQLRSYGQFRMLCLNGRKQQLAKWPNNGFAYYEDVIGSNTFRYKNLNASNWTTAKDMYINGYPAYEYAGGSYSCIVDPLERTIQVNTSIKADYRWRAINLLEELDIPGEYYIDADNMILYYYPEKMLDPQKDILEMGRWAFEIVTVENCDYFNFDGITFALSDGAGLKYNKTKNSYVKNCIFRNLQQGLVVDNAINFTVEDNTFYYLSSYAVSVGPDEEISNYNNLVPSGLVVRNNHMSNCFLDYIGMTATIGANGVETVVENNTISGSVTGGIIGAGVDAVYRYNEMYNLVRETADAGAFYMGRTWIIYGNTYEYNYIHDLGDKSFSSGNLVDGIFWDDTGSGQTARYNIIYPNSKQKTYGIISGGGRDQKVYNNIIVGSEQSIGMQDRTSGTTPIEKYTDRYPSLEKAVKENWGVVKKYPEILNTYKLQYFRPDNNIVSNNVIVNAKEINFSDHVKNSPTSTIGGNYVGKDMSIFVDPENQDFRVKKSAKEELGLDESVLDEDFDITKIGIQREPIEVDNSFYKTYPKNGDKGFDPREVTLSWQRSTFADEYYYEVATDLEFENVVQSGTTVYTNVLLDELSEDTGYYWRVTAKNISRAFPFSIIANGDPYYFKTASVVEVIDKTSLNAKIHSAELLYKEINENNEIGGYKEGTKDALKTAIDVAKVAAEKKDISQIGVYNAESVLEVAINIAKSSVHVGYLGTIDTNPESWNTYQPEKVTITGSGNEITITRNATGGLAATNDILPSYGIYTFEAKESGIATSGGNWFAIALRHSNHNSDNIYSAAGLASCFVLVKKDQVELQTRTIENRRNLMLTVPNDGFYTYGDWIRFEFGVIPLRKGMLVTLKMNDRQVFEYLDEVDPLRTEGRLCVSPQESLTLRAVEEAKNNVEYIAPESIYDNAPEIKYYAVSDEECTLSGNWIGNIELKGFDDEPVMTVMDIGATAEFNVNPSNIGGYYKVSAYIPEIKNADPEAEVYFSSLYTNEIVKVDLSEAEKGWLDLGTYDFRDQTDKSKMLIRFKSSGKGILPVNIIRCEPISNEEKSYLELFKKEMLNGIVMKIGDKKVISKGNESLIDTVPIIENDTTLVPLRFITEIMGGSVEWKEDTKTALISIDEKSFAFTENKSSYTINGKECQTEQPARIINDRMMIPLRIVSEDIGKEVYWNDEYRIIIIADELNISEELETLEKLNSKY